MKLILYSLFLCSIVHCIILSWQHWHLVFTYTYITLFLDSFVALLHFFCFIVTFSLLGLIFAVLLYSVEGWLGTPFFFLWWMLVTGMVFMVFDAQCWVSSMCKLLTRTYITGFVETLQSATVPASSVVKKYQLLVTFKQLTCNDKWKNHSNSFFILKAYGVGV